MPLGNIALQYVIQNNCRKVWWCFSYDFLHFHFLEIKKKICQIHQNYLVALIRFEYILPLTSCWEFSTSYVHCTDIWPLFLWPLTSQGKLEASFEEIESMLNMLEDTCEEEELIKNKKTQIAELAKYRHQKEWDPYQTVSVPKNSFRYMKEAQFSTPLHQYSEKKLKKKQTSTLQSY